MKSLEAIATDSSTAQPRNQQLLPLSTPNSAVSCGTVSLQGAVSVMLPAKLIGSGKMARSSVRKSDPECVVWLMICHNAIGTWHSEPNRSLALQTPATNKSFSQSLASAVTQYK